MKYKIDGITYDVSIQRKKIRNLYIRYKDAEILVSVPVKVSDTEINSLLERNVDALRKMIRKDLKRVENLFLGEKIDIVAVSNLKNPEVVKQRLFIRDKSKLDDAYKKLAEPIFKERLDYIYNLFDEDIPYPQLKIRKMTSRWGVCNRKSMAVTLNLELIKWDIIYIDYVITHELSHFVHFNHSASFWQTVSKYCPQYKLLRKKLRE